MNYQETLAYLYNALPAFEYEGEEAYKPGLERITALCKALGSPQKTFRSVHVAGTNGKGSVSHMLAAALMAADYRVGLFTSPHLKDFRERVRINGVQISEESVIDFVTRHRDIFEEIKPSFFELSTALAFDQFARHHVDIAIIEVGMGGRLDSTNIIRPLVSVITNIGRDHTKQLGETIEEIALEKAGIIKSDTPVVIGERKIETQLLFIQKAKEFHAPILFADQCYRVLSQQVVERATEDTATSSTPRRWEIEESRQVPLQIFRIESLLEETQFTLESDLMGEYQRKNILTTLTALDVLNGSGGLSISPAAVHHGLAHTSRSTGLLGRWQVIEQRPFIICDTGHNEDGLREVMAQLRHQHYKKLYMVLGFVADRDLTTVLPLLPKEAYYLFTKANNPRSLDEKELQAAASNYALYGESTPSALDALKKAKEMAGAEDLIFVGGSTYLVAEII